MYRNQSGGSIFVPKGGRVLTSGAVLRPGQKSNEEMVGQALGAGADRGASALKMSMARPEYGNTILNRARRYQ
jgi:hypothetical protein